MIYILLSIFSSTCIFIVFKLLGSHKVDTTKAIVINYIAACLFGILTTKKSINVDQIVSEKWFYGAIFLGIMFIVLFNVMAKTAQKNGLSVASVATKMSVVIPIVFGILLYHEKLNIVLVLGILTALLAVYLTSSKSNTVSNLKQNLTLPIILFIGSGFIDATIKFLQSTYMANDDISIFSASIFFFAALIGVGYMIIKQKFSLNFKTIFGGIVLGLVNFGSLYFLIKALQLDGWSSATVFTLNNVGIVMLSTLVGKFFFKEHLLLKNWVGIVLAVLSIFMITLAI